MKTLLFISLVFCSFNSFAQSDSIPKIENGYGYEEIVKLDTTSTKDILYQNAKVFFVDKFKSAKDVIQYDDKNEGKIIGKGLFKIDGFQKANLLYGWNLTWKVNFSTEIICKNGKYKYKIYDIRIDENGILNSTEYAERNKEMSIDNIIKESEKNSKIKKSYQPMYNNMTIEFKATIRNIKDYMAKMRKDDF